MVTIHIRSSSEAKTSVSIDVTTATVADLKREIEKSLPDFPASAQRLIFSGKVLKDDDLLHVYKIADQNTVHVVKSVPRTTTSSTATSTTSTTTTSNPTSSTIPSDASSSFPSNNPAMGANPFAAFAGLGGVPPNSGATGQGNPFANPMLAAMMGGGMGGSGSGNGMSGMSDMPGMLGMLNSNPAMMEMMSQQMQSMFNNPQMLDTMASMNPALASPEYRAIMQAMVSNPDSLRAMMSLAANPAMNPVAAMMGGGGSINSPSISGSLPNTTDTGNSASGSPMVGMNPFLLGMLGGAGAGAGAGVGGGTTSAVGAPSIPPEERYATQLQQLAEMGMLDGERNIRALQLTGGNVHAAIEWLFNNPQ